MDDAAASRRETWGLSGMCHRHGRSDFTPMRVVWAGDLGGGVPSSWIVIERLAVPRVEELGLETLDVSGCRKVSPLFVSPFVSGTKSMPFWSPVMPKAWVSLAGPLHRSVSLRAAGRVRRI